MQQMRPVAAGRACRAFAPFLAAVPRPLAQSRPSCQSILSCSSSRRQLLAGVVLAGGLMDSSSARRSVAQAAAVSDKEKHCLARGARRSRTLAAAASSAAAAAASQQSLQQLRGKDTVVAFYDAYNRRDLATIEQLIADDISYHDLVYEEPHEGRQGVMAWLEKVRQYAPDDLKFVIEDITDGDAAKVGVKWHVQCGDGVFFPFSRGVSFITLNDDGKIVTVRDVVEPALKPGDSTLQLLGTLTPLIRKLGPDADPSRLKQLPIAAAAVWALYAGYMSVVMFSRLVPGEPVFSTPPEVFAEIFQESINIFWINDALTALHLSFIPNVPSPPVSEAVFNFVLAWAAMLLPVILTDGAAQKVQKKGWWAVGIMFITNVFFIPFMALRAAPEPLEPAAAAAAAATTTSSSRSGASSQQQQQQQLRPRKVAAPGSQQLPGWAKGMGAFGLFMGVFAVYWALAGRPEFGNLADRAGYLQATLNSNRVFWAFWLDMVLFYTFQLTLLQAAPAAFRFVPFFGLAGWLIAGGTQPSASGSK